MNKIYLNLPSAKKERKNEYGEFIFSAEEGVLLEKDEVKKDFPKFDNPFILNNDGFVKVPTIDKPDIKENIKVKEDDNKIEGEKVTSEISVGTIKESELEQDDLNKVEEVSTPEPTENPIIETKTFTDQVEIDTQKDISKTEKDATEAADKLKRNLENISYVDNNVVPLTPKEEEIKQKELDVNKDKALDNFGKDLFFNRLWGDNSYSNSAVFSMSLAKDTDLWNDKFIQGFYKQTYKENAKSKFEEDYKGIAKEYNELHKLSRDQFMAMQQYQDITVTGNKMIDIITATAESPEKGKKVDELYKTMYENITYTEAREGFIGKQNKFGESMGVSPYKTVGEAMFSTYMNDKGELVPVKEGDTERFNELGKMFISKSSDLYGKQLTDRGSVYMELAPLTRRLGANYDVVKAYETSDEHFWYSWLRRTQKAELEGVGDWSSVLLSSLVDTSYMLANSVVTLGHAFYSSVTGEESETLRSYTNSLAKYTPGMTYESTLNSTGGESIVVNVANAVSQLLIGSLLGKGFKGSLKPFYRAGKGATQVEKLAALEKYNLAGSRAAQLGVRTTLTLYGAGTMYDDALKKGFSEREASAYFAASFIGLWYVNSMSKWITDSAEQKVLYKNLRNFLKEKMPAATTAYKGAGGGEKGFKALIGYFDKAGEQWGKYIPKVLKGEAITSFATEGAEEFSEDIMQAVVDQGMNFYVSATGQSFNEKGFSKMSDEGYWGDLVSQASFSGLIGGLSGGLMGGVKQIANRRLKDVEQIDTYTDIIAKGHEKQFLKVMKEFDDKSFFGAKDIDIRSTEGNTKIVDEDSEYSQANFNKSVILTDYLLTRKALGDNAKLNLTLDSEAEIDLAVKAKKTMKDLIDIYAKYDITFDNFQEIERTSLEEFNKKRKDNTKEITPEDYKSLVELNNVLADIKDGKAHQYEWFKKVIYTDPVFGNSEFREDKYKDSKFNDLAYKYFNKIMDFSKEETSLIDEKLINLAKSEDIDIGDDFNSFKKALIEFKKNNVISKDQYKKAFSVLEEAILTDDLYTSIKPKFESDLKDFLEKKGKQLAEDLTNEINTLNKEINDIKVKETPEAPLSKEDEKLISEKEAQVKLKEKDIVFFNTVDQSNIDFALSYQVLGFNISNNINDGFINVRARDFANLKNSHVKQILRYSSEDAKSNKHLQLFSFDPVEGEYEFKQYKELKDKYLSSYNDLQALTVTDVQSLENNKILNTKFLNRVALISEDGEISDSGMDISAEMLKMIDELGENLKQFGPEGQKENIIGVSLQETLDKFKSLQIHNRFINLMKTNLQTINSVNRYIEGVKTGKISITKGGNTAFGKFIRRNKLYKPLSFSLKLLKPFTLSGIQVAPDVKIDYSGIEGGSPYVVDLNNKLFDLKKALRKETDLNKKDILNKKIETLTNQISKEHSLHNSIIDNDRMSLLKNKKNKTNKESQELKAYEDRLTQLTSPSIEILKTFVSIDNEGVPVIEKEIKNLKEAILKKKSELESNKNLEENYNNLVDLKEKIDQIDESIREVVLNNINLQLSKSNYAKIKDELNSLEEKLKEKEDDLNELNSISEEKKQAIWDNLIAKEDEYNEKISNPNISIEERQSLAKQGSPIYNYILDKLNKEALNNESGTNDVNNILEYMKKVYTNDDLTIADRSIITTAFYNILIDQAKKFMEMGEGVNYEQDIIDSTTSFFNTIREVLNGVNFKCFE